MLYAEAIDLLGLVNPTQAEIKKVYRQLVRELHPDAGGSDSDFCRLHEAYQTALAGPEAEPEEACNTYSSNNSQPIIVVSIILIALSTIWSALCAKFGLHYIAINWVCDITFKQLFFIGVVAYLIYTIYKQPDRLIILALMAFVAFLGWQELSPFYSQLICLIDNISSAFVQTANVF